jgi:hypothetical protein
MTTARNDLLADLHRMRRIFAQQGIPKRRIPEARRQDVRNARPQEVLAHIHADLEYLASQVRRGELVLAAHHVGVAKGLYMKAAQTTIEVTIRG